jgi:hypothetical protein
MKKFLLQSVLFFSVLSCSLFIRSNLQAQVVLTSRSTGNWNNIDNWISSANLTGTISTSTSSATVTGSGTAFLSQLSEGADLYQANGTTKIGTVQTIHSNTSLTLTANAANNNTNISFKIRKIPAGNDAVIIGGGHTVTIPAGLSANAGSITISASGNSQALALASATSSLIVSGNVVLNQPTNGNNTQLIIDAGTVIIGGDLNLLTTATNSNRCNRVRITTGTLTIGGNLYLNNPNQATQNCGSNGGFGAPPAMVSIDMSGGAGTLNLAGSLSFNLPAVASLGLSSNPGSVFNFNGTTAQTIPVPSSANWTYSNLNINNTYSGGATLEATITSTKVTGNLSVGNVNSGSLLNTDNYNIALGNSRTLTVAAGSVLNAGTSVVSFGTSGTAIINGTFKTANTNGFSGSLSTAISSANSPSINIGANSTIEFNAAATQTVNQRSDYANVVLSGGSKTPAAGTHTIAKNLTISSGTTFNGSINNPVLNLGGDFINNGTFIAGSSTVVFQGSSAQNISGTSSTTFHHLTINNNAGLNLSGTHSVGGALTFSSGLINTSASNLLQMLAGSSMSGAGEASYVNGPLRKYGNTAFTFPVGNASVYAPVSLSAPALVTDAFTVQYFRSSATALGSISAPGLATVSNCEYWDISRTAGSSSVNVTLSWSAGSPCNPAGYITNLSYLTIAHFNGSTWNSHGHDGGTTGNIAAGTVTWNNVSDFSKFSLGSTSASFNPLPVKFAAIKVVRTAQQTHLVSWSNLTEEDILNYEVQRSADGISFNTIGTVNATHNNNSRADYSFTDPVPFNGHNFYRIRAVENSGKTLTSAIVKINSFGSSDVTGLSVYPVPVQGNQITLQATGLPAGAYQAMITDLSGRVVSRSSIQHPGGMLAQTLELPSVMSPGIYYLQVTGQQQKVITRFVVQ